MSQTVDRGHNKPPELVPLIEIQGLDAQLRVDWKHLFTRRDELLKMVADWLTDHPDKRVLDDEDAALANDTLAQVLREIDSIDKTSSVGIRADVKRPLLDAGKIADNIFGAELATKLRTAAATLNQPLLAYAQEKRRNAEAERTRLIQVQQAAELQRRQDAEQAAAEIAREAAAAASPKPYEEMTEAELDAAVAAEQAAIEALPIPAPVVFASPPPVKPTRIEGDLNSTSFLRGKWVAVINDPLQVPRQYCMPAPAMIDAAMRASIPGKGKAPTVQIPGVTFEFQEGLQTRRGGA